MSDYERHEAKMDCLRFVKDKIQDQMDHRHETSLWIEVERWTALWAAINWINDHNMDCYVTPITLDEIEKFETSAAGYVDYLFKWSLRIADRIYYGKR